MMSSQDFNFVDILKRKRIKLTLRTAAYIGTVQRINLNKTIILEDVVDVKDGRKIPGVKMFFGHEVLNVEMPDETQNRKPPDQILEGHLIVDEFQPYRKSVTLDGDEDDEEDYINFVVIDEFHEKFGPAVMQIKKQQVIGVGADGVEAMQRLCWLQIATKNTVYLFDILQLGGRAFKNGLSMILESKRILKVIHDSKGVAACLTTSFGVKLTNVFDTQVADVLWFYKETGGILPDRVSTLAQVVGFHLEVPSSRLSSLLIKSKLTKEDGEIWYKRPCPVALLKVMALSVIHLQPLRLMLLDALMKDYTDLVNAYLTSDPGYPSNELDLPLELRDMERIREERYEMAIQMYPITDQGLLERYNPRPQPKISPPANGHQNQDNPRPQPKISPPANGHQNQDNPRPQPKISPTANGHQNLVNSRPQPKISPPANGHQNLVNSRPQPEMLPPANGHQNLVNSRPQPEMLPPANGRWNQDQDALPQMELVDSAYPATVEPISPMRVDSPCPQPYAPSPVAQIPATAPASDLKKPPSSSVPPPDEAPGLMEMMMDTIGRGWPLKKDPQSSVPVFPVFPSFGRGFPVHMPQPQKTPGAMDMVPPTLKSTPANGAIPKTVLPGIDVGLEVGYSNPTPQHLISQLSPLSRSFNSFRST